MKDLGMCKECGLPIRDFKWALPDWLCRYCYDAKFPQPGNERLFGALSKKSYLKNEESYAFLKAHLYDKPGLYEPGFRLVRDYSMLLRNFSSLSHLLDFVQTHRSCLGEIKMELVNLGRSHQWLKPRVMEILLFVLWDDLLDTYGKSERFSQGYMDLMLEISPATTELAGADAQAQPLTPTTGVWNYQASKILSKAVSQDVISQLEAEVVMEKVVYERDYFDIQKILGVSTFEAFALYETALIKLGKWAKHSVLVLPGGQIIVD